MVFRALLRPIGGWLKRRAENDPDRITIWIVPARGYRTDQIEMPGWCKTWGGSLLVLAAILFCASVAADVILLRRAMRTEQIRAENRELQVRLARMEDLEREIGEIDRFRRQLSQLAGLEDPGRTGGAPGVGDSLEAGGATGRPPRIDLTEEAWRTPLRVLPYRGPVSRGFRSSTGSRGGHLGVDVAGPVGSPIRAAAEGVVEEAAWDEAYGHLLVLQHADGWKTRYGHNERILVEPGDSVEAGEKVALLGNTGISSAPHLHFEILKGETAIDPAEYFFPYQGGISEGRNGRD